MQQVPMQSRTMPPVGVGVAPQILPIYWPATTSTRNCSGYLVPQVVAYPPSPPLLQLPPPPGYVSISPPPFAGYEYISISPPQMFDSRCTTPVTPLLESASASHMFPEAPSAAAAATSKATPAVAVPEFAERTRSTRAPKQRGPARSHPAPGARPPRFSASRASQPTLPFTPTLPSVPATPPTSSVVVPPLASGDNPRRRQLEQQQQREVSVQATAHASEVAGVWYTQGRQYSASAPSQQQQQQQVGWDTWPSLATAGEAYGGFAQRPLSRSSSFASIGAFSDPSGSAGPFLQYSANLMLVGNANDARSPTPQLECAPFPFPPNNGGNTGIGIGFDIGGGSIFPAKGIPVVPLNMTPFSMLTPLGAHAAQSSPVNYQLLSQAQMLHQANEQQQFLRSLVTPSSMEPYSATGQQQQQVANAAGAALSQRPHPMPMAPPSDLMRARERRTSAPSDSDAESSSQSVNLRADLRNLVSSRPASHCSSIDFKLN